MTDIVERLREMARYKHDDLSIGAEAADLIETLRARIVFLEQALDKYSEDEMLLKAGRSAMEHFREANGDSEPDPVERLRFYCSLAMQGQDWLDVEPFFDALKAGQGEPVSQSYIQTVPDKCDRIVWRNAYYMLPPKATTIPKGWQIVPIEPTQEMLIAVRGHAGSNHEYFYRTMLSAAPQPGGQR